MYRPAIPRRKRPLAILIVLTGLIPVLLTGCGKQDPTLNAAPPAKSDAVAPPPVTGKDARRLPPLVGPKAGGDKGGGF